MKNKYYWTWLGLIVLMAILFIGQFAVIKNMADAQPNGYPEYLIQETESGEAIRWAVHSGTYNEGFLAEFPNMRMVAHWDGFEFIYHMIEIPAPFELVHFSYVGGYSWNTEAGTKLPSIVMFVFTNHQDMVKTFAYTLSGGTEIANTFEFQEGISFNPGEFGFGNYCNSTSYQLTLNWMNKWEWQTRPLEAYYYEEVQSCHS